MEIHRWQMQLEDAERRLRCLEADPHMITSLQEAEYYERMLEESLNRVRLRKQLLEENQMASFNQASLQLYLQNANPNGASTSDSQMLHWFTQRDPQSSVQNFLEHGHSNGILTIRDSHVEECMPNGVVFPGHIPQEGHGNYQLGNHASDHSSPAQMRFDYTALEGNAGDHDQHHQQPHPHHNMGEYGSPVGLAPSQWQPPYAAAAASLMSSMVHNQYNSLVQGMMENVPGIMTQQQEESSSHGALSTPQEDVGIDVSFQNNMGDPVTGPDCQ